MRGLSTRVPDKTFWFQLWKNCHRKCAAAWKGFLRWCSRQKLGWGLLQVSWNETFTPCSTCVLEATCPGRRLTCWTSHSLSESHSLSDQDCHRIVGWIRYRDPKNRQHLQMQRQRVWFIFVVSKVANRPPWTPRRPCRCCSSTLSLGSRQFPLSPVSWTLRNRKSISNLSLLEMSSRQYYSPAQPWRRTPT